MMLDGLVTGCVGDEGTIVYAEGLCFQKLLPGS